MMKLLVFFVLTTLLTHSFATDCFSPEPAVFAKFCSDKGCRMVVGDFDGNGYDDLLCHDPNQGHIDILYSHRSSFQPLTWSKDIDWCIKTEDKNTITELHAADFNGDGRTDLLCHGLTNGHKNYAFANNEGVFTGTSHHVNMGWCWHKGAVLKVGDFNGDGRADINCHDQNSGYKWFAYAGSDGKIHSDSWNMGFPKCTGEILIGDFNGDRKSDFLCYDYNSGRIQISIMQSNNRLRTNFHQEHSGNKWCTDRGAFLRIADINKDGLDDFICKDDDPAGYVKIIRNTFKQNGKYFDPSTTTYTTHFCTSSKRQNFYTGRFTSGEEDDLLCIDETGTIRVEESQCV